MFGLAAVYFGAAKLGLTLAVVAEQVTVVWPPSGISLAALVVFGPRVWPGIALGAFLANATTSAPMTAALGMALGNTLEALCGAWLLRRFVHFNPALHRLKDVLSLTFLAAGLSTMVSATIGVACLCLANVQPWAAYDRLWWVWWLGDATSDLVVAPLLLTLSTTMWRPRSLSDLRRVIEAGTLAALLVILLFKVFSGPATGGIAHELAYAVFPFVIWAALRFGPLGSAAVTFLASAIAIWGTLRGHGPFAREQVNESLILIQLFMAVVAVTGMFLAAAVTEAQRAGRRASAQYAAARILAEAGTRDEALRSVLECVRAELEWHAAAFWVAEEKEGVLRLLDICSDPSLKMPEQGAGRRGQRCAHGEGLPGTVWVTANPVWLRDIPDENRSPRIATASRGGLAGVLGVPVLLDGEVYGVMEFFSRGRRPPDEDLLEMTTAIGRQIGQFIEKRSAEEALLRSEERYRAFIQKSSEGIWRCEVAQPIEIDMPELEQIECMYRSGYLAECNDAMARMYGFSSAAEIVGSRLGNLLPQSDAHNVEFLRSFIRGGYRLDEVESHELDRDGNPKIFLNSMVGFVKDVGLVRAWGTQRDVTEHKRMEVALRDADRRKDEFLAMLAHELRNPISAINSAAELGQHPQISEQDLRWSQEIIQRQVKHLSRLVDDLLDVSRIIHGKIELRHEPLDIDVIIKQAIESVRPLIDQRAHHFELVMPPADLPLTGDATRVEQIIVNLLTNAAKYTEAGGLIRLTVEKTGTQIIIKIRDTGVGIPPEKIAEMFELFSQGDRSLARSEGGLGIGLTLVKRLTEMHGGSVTAHSEGTGKGSEFVVRLPLAQKTSLGGATQPAADVAPGNEAIIPCVIR